MNSEEKSSAIWYATEHLIPRFDDPTAKVVFAALVAMTKGIHAIQEDLTDGHWELAEEMTYALENVLNERHG
jgi:hypothetical protein